MPHSGLSRKILGEVTLKKAKGKKLAAEIGKAFSPEAILRKNNETQKKRK